MSHASVSFWTTFKILNPAISVNILEVELSGRWLGVINKKGRGKMSYSIIPNIVSGLNLNPIASN